MAVKSSHARYGAVAAGIHWLSALAVILMLASGQVMSSGNGPVGAILPFHVVLGVLVGLLTLFRVLWWLAFDKKPAVHPGLSRPQEWLARIVHFALYVAVLFMVASGIGMVALTDAAPAIFGGGELPRFNSVPPFMGHSLVSKLLFFLALGHVAAALLHHFVKRDGLIGRMRFGG
ncbi:MAG: cytochrome B [Phyllobacteriaceae bacterium]|nr:cytochrome B [Phyllobacteriaceae bacterium]